MIKYLLILLLPLSVLGADIQVGYSGTMTSNVTLSESNSYLEIATPDQYASSDGDFFDSTYAIFRYAEDSAKTYLYWNDGGTWTLEDSSGWMISSSDYDTVLSVVDWQLTGSRTYRIGLSNLNGAGGTIPLRGSTYLTPGPTVGSYSQASASPPATFTGTTEVYFRLGIWATGESAPAVRVVITTSGDD